MELVEGGSKPHAVAGEPDETHERFEQAARQPLHLLRPWILARPARVAELARIGLRADHAAIEEDVVADVPVAAPVG